MQIQAAAIVQCLIFFDHSLPVYCHRDTGINSASAEIDFIFPDFRSSPYVQGLAGADPASVSIVYSVYRR